MSPVRLDRAEILRRIRALGPSWSPDQAPGWIFDDLLDAFEGSAQAALGRARELGRQKPSTTETDDEP